MIDYPWQHIREDWEDPNQTIDMHTSSPTFPWQTADLIAIHYTAAPRIPGDISKYLRAIQNDYVTNRGYSIVYSAAVTQTGDDYELRGIRHRAAANAGMNQRTFTILVLVDGADPLTGQALDKVRRLVAWFRNESPNNVRIVGHREIGATACPGDGVFAQIEAGLLEPLPEPPIGDDIVGEYVKVDTADTAMLVRSPHWVWWLPTGADVGAVADLCVNTAATATILSQTDRAGLTFLGDQPHYHQASQAGAVRCRSDMFGSR